MTEAPAADEPSGDSFDLDQFERLVQLMDTHDLREVRLSKGGQKWHVKRGVEPVAFSAVPAAAPAPPPQAAAQTPAESSHATAAATPRGRTIDSPAVGTFYSKPDPADPPFVSVGSQVSPTTVVCLIEAMKVYNQIQAETSGKVTKVLVNDGDAVEFGQPLFELE